MKISKVTKNKLLHVLWANMSVKADTIFSAINQQTCLDTQANQIHFEFISELLQLFSFNIIRIR